MKIFLYWVLIFILTIIFIATIVGLGAFVFTALWNLSMPVLNFPTIDFWQGFGFWGLIVLITTSFKGVKIPKKNISP